MKRWVPAIALLGVAAAIGLYLSHSSKTQTGARAVSEPVVTGSANQGPKSNALVSPPGTGLTPAAPATLPSTSAPPAIQTHANSPPPQALELGDLDFRVAGPTKIAAETVLENMRTAIRDYSSMFGGNPVGTNPEITAALNGDNPKQARLLKADAGMRINGNGELVDPWGTPFFFHQLSGTQMEIHSAGPDKTMWTSDDLVVK
jgi:hypothetical protein